MSSDKLVWFITGVNSGFGLLLANLALSEGHTIIGTARSASKFPASLKESPNADLIELEIVGPSSPLVEAIDSAVARHGRIDVLVNNAGYGLLGAAEEVSEADARYQFDVNFFGPLNLCKAVIPHMRRQKSGTILMISSGTGILGVPGGPVYTASKFAVEGFGESLAQEVKPFGIRVQIIEPGIFRTNFLTSVAEGKQARDVKEGYIDVAGALGQLHGSEPGNPALAVQRLYEVVTNTGMGAALHDELRVPLGSDCYGMLETKIASYQNTAAKTKEIAYSTDFTS